jgi:hypothetical protein
MLKQRYIFRHFEKVKTTAINLNFGFEILKQYKTEAPYIAPPIPYRISWTFPFNGLCVKEIYKLRKLRIKEETI